MEEGVLAVTGICPSNSTEESERLRTALTAQIGTLSVGGRDLGNFLCKISLLPLFLLVFPQAGEQLPARGGFFALMQTGFAYRQEAALFSEPSNAGE